jgi:aminoglycoside phosphotransferase (APT) family kinase protein
VGDASAGAPSDDVVRAILNVVAPGSVALAVGPLPVSASNHTHVVDARAADGSALRLVVHRYAAFGDYDRGAKARREFRAFRLLHANGLPAPRPLLLDDDGATLGVPGIVTAFVPGRQVTAPADTVAWARSLATTLADLHALQVDADLAGDLLDANAEATWFARSPTVPDFLAAHPEGPAVWRWVRDRTPWWSSSPSGLVHLDYWSGNVLWDGGRIVAVLDWEEAALGDPGVDVAYARMDMFLLGLPKAAELFLRAYEAATQRPVAHLGLWQLAAAARPMFAPDGWITGAPAAERFAAFVADSHARVVG